jgi:hypothetical protein
MDPSDILRKKQAQAVYSFYKTTVFNTSGVINTVAYASATPIYSLGAPLNHGMNIGDKIVFASIGNGVVFSSPVTLNTIYYIIAIGAAEFQFSATLGGSAITYTGTITAAIIIYGPRAFVTNSLACTSLAGSAVNYPSYEDRQKVLTGSQSCNGCSNLGCGCSA